MEKIIRTALSATCIFAFSALPLAAAETSQEEALGSELYQKAKASKNEKDQRGFLLAAVSKNYPAAVLEEAEYVIRTGSRMTNYTPTFERLQSLLRHENNRYYTPTDRAKTFYLIGQCHQKGLGTLVISQTKALECFLIAAPYNAEATLAAAQILKKQDTLLKNGVEASMLLFFDACRDEAVREKALNELKKDDELSVRFLKMLIPIATAGDVNAMRLLAAYYEPLSESASQKYLKMAAELRDGEANLWLGKILEKKKAKGTDKQIEEYLLAAYWNPATKQQAAEALVAHYNRVGKPQKTVPFLYTLKDYKSAKAIFESKKGDKIDADTLYVQAKLYEQTAKANNTFRQQEYERQMDMAVNAGSINAKLERLEGLPIRKALNLMQKSFEYKNKSPEYLCRMGVLALKGIKTKNAKPEEALQYLETAAQGGNLDALYLLWVAYERSSATLGIAANPEKAVFYRSELLKYDIHGAKAQAIHSLVQDIPSGKVSKESALPILASKVVHSPAAAAAMADLLAPLSPMTNLALAPLTFDVKKGAYADYEQQVRDLIQKMPGKKVK